MLSRIELAKHFNELGFKKGAEIGVFDGYYSEILCREISGLSLYSIDGWDNYGGYRNGAYHIELQKALKTAQDRLAKYDCKIIQEFSKDAVKRFEDESLDFVFIDANHTYQYVKEDIELWTPKVRKGGIVSGHDYYVGKSGKMGVIEAVNEYIKNNNYKLEIIDWYRNTSNKNDKPPTWYFIK